MPSLPYSFSEHGRSNSSTSRSRDCSTGLRPRPGMQLPISSRVQFVHDRMRIPPFPPSVCALGQNAQRLHDGSWMTRECHVQFCERLGVKLPGATLPTGTAN